MPVIVAIACYWYLDHRRVAKARADYSRTAMQYEVGLLRVRDLCAASKRLAETEQQSYFVGPARARAGHLLRAHEIEHAFEAKIAVSLFGSEGGREQAAKMLDEVIEHRKEAEDWLKETLDE